WSAFRGSTPSRTAISTVSSKVAGARVFTSSSASVGVNYWSPSKRLVASMNLLPCGMAASRSGAPPGRGPPGAVGCRPRGPPRMLWSDDLDAHRAGGAADHLLGGLDVVGVQVGHLGLG